MVSHVHHHIFELYKSIMLSSSFLFPVSITLDSHFPFLSLPICFKYCKNVLFNLIQGEIEWHSVKSDHLSSTKQKYEHCYETPNPIPRNPQDHDSLDHLQELSQEVFSPPKRVITNNSNFSAEPITPTEQMNSSQLTNEQLEWNGQAHPEGLCRNANFLERKCLAKVQN